MTDDEERLVRMLIGSLEGMVGLVQLIMPSITDVGQRDAVEANHRLIEARSMLASAKLKWSFGS
jgi:hypothetical protein